MGAPTEPSDLKGQVYLRFVDLYDSTKVIALKTVPTGDPDLPDGTVVHSLVVDTNVDVQVDIDLPDDLEYTDSITLGDTNKHQMTAQALKDGVIFKADGDNAGNIRVGGSVITPTKGMKLQAGESVKLRADNADKMYYQGTNGADILHIVGG